MNNAFFCESKAEPSIEMAAAVSGNQPNEDWQEIVTDEDLPF